MRLELYRLWCENRRGAWAMLSGIAALVAGYLLFADTRLFGFLVAHVGDRRLLWLFCAWSWMLGAAFDVSRGVLADVRAGVMAGIAARRGFFALAGTRHSAALVWGLPPAVVLAGVLLAFRGPPQAPAATELLLLACLLIQSYATSALMATASLLQKSEHAAQLVVVAVFLPLTLLPADQLLGRGAELLLVVGPLAAIRGGAGWAESGAVLAVSCAWLAASWLAASAVERRTFAKGSLLF